MTFLFAGNFNTDAAVAKVDPVLTAAVGTQVGVEQQIQKERKSMQEKMITAEATVTAALDRVHKVENQMLDYLSEASSVMSNLYQIKRAAELVGVEIPQNIVLLTNSVKGNLKGTAIAAIVSDEINDVYAQMASLYPFMKQLVTSGTYETTEGGQTVNKKVNLLNSAERYYIANEVVRRLEKIKIDLFILAWQCRTLSWNSLWYRMDPKGWCNIMSGKITVEYLIRKWNQL
ncbi:MAG: hypothetical protein HDR48_03720 [Bacteroides sp.]|nr:hypothetical protein [Bacteroides sp.]